MTRLKVDRDLCIGSGNCVFFAPAVFQLDDEGISTVGGGPDSAAAAEEMSDEQVETVVSQCPTGAISVAEE